MAAIECRRFTIADSVILIAATAVGLAANHVFLVILSSHSGRIYKLAIQTLPYLSAWTVGFFAIRLRGPRPNRRRLMRQAGMVACCSPPLFVAMVTALILLSDLVKWRSNINSLASKIPMTLMYLLPSGGISVLVSWGILSIGGGRRRESGWIDWLGIWLGVGWIMLSLTRLYDDI